jgi:hypothetical protein
MGDIQNALSEFAELLIVSISGCSPEKEEEKSSAPNGP